MGRELHREIPANRLPVHQLPVHSHDLDQRPGLSLGVETGRHRHRVRRYIALCEHDLGAQVLGIGGDGLQGLGITFITVGLMSLGFMSFGGISL